MKIVPVISVRMPLNAVVKGEFDMRRFQKTMLFRKLILLLLALVLAGCQSLPASSYEPLSEEKITEIKTVWERSSLNSSKGHPCWWDLTSNKQYYGTHGDCVAIFVEALTNAEEILDVAGVKIWNGNGFRILVYRNGEFAKLEDAYQKGWLAKENIESIAEHHKNQLSYYPDDL